MSFLPSVVDAEYLDGHRIRVVFNDGLEGVIDLADMLEGPIFDALKDDAYFQRFFIEGGTLNWPNGADVAPETLYAHVSKRKAA